MESLVPVFNFVATMIRDFLVAFNSHWYLQILLFLPVLALVVHTIILMRR